MTYPERSKLSILKGFTADGTNITPFKEAGAQDCHLKPLDIDIIAQEVNALEEKLKRQPLVVVIDDERDTLELLAILLTSQTNSQHITYPSADEAYRELTSDQVNPIIPDIVYVDRMMPGMDGVEFVRQYSQYQKNVLKLS